MSENRIVLHHAEELGQARAYTTEEAQALFRLATIIGLWVGTSALLLGLGYWMYDRWDFWTAFYVLSLPLGVLIGGGLVLAKGVHEQLDGLRSWREATTYAPPQPEPPTEPPHPPILVRPYQGQPYTIGNPQLPGREEALQLTPPVVAEILKASLEQYGGEWSRRKLMALKIQGQGVSRGLYEELTGWLTKTGFLQQTRQGGFTLPPDVREFDDLRAYFPSLPGLGGLGGMGGNREGWERGVSQVSQSAGGEVSSLAERRRQKWLELGCDVTAYLEWRRNHGS